jgi:glutaryl-CoA dehydrogenase (non-decarboxylating)
MVDFSLSEEHDMLRDSVREFLEREVEPIVSDYDKQQKSLYPKMIPKMGELGLLGVCFPERYGGAGLDYIALAIVCEELERVDTALRVVMSVHVGLNSCTLLQWGTEEQKKKYLIPQAQGKKVGAYGLTEPCCGSDPASLQTRAVKYRRIHCRKGFSWNFFKCNP